MKLHGTLTDITAFTNAWHPFVFVATQLDRKAVTNLLETLKHPQPGAAVSAIFSTLGEFPDPESESPPVLLDAFFPNRESGADFTVWKSATVSLGSVYGTEDGDHGVPIRALRIEDVSELPFNNSFSMANPNDDKITVQFQAPRGVSPAACWKLLQQFHAHNYSEEVARFFKQLRLVYKSTKSANMLDDAHETGSIHFSPTPVEYCDGWVLSGLWLRNPSSVNLSALGKSFGSVTLTDVFAFGFPTMALEALGDTSDASMRKLAASYGKGAADDLGPSHFMVFRQYKVPGPNQPTIYSPAIEFLVPFGEEEKGGRYLRAAVVRNISPLSASATHFDWNGGRLKRLDAAFSPAATPALYVKFLGDDGIESELRRFKVVDGAFATAGARASRRTIVEAVSRVSDVTASTLQVQHGPFVLDFTRATANDPVRTKAVKGPPRVPPKG